MKRMKINENGLAHLKNNIDWKISGCVVVGTKLEEQLLSIREHGFEYSHQQ